MERKSRAIRLSDTEWTAFKSLLGSPWLRKQIERAIAKESRKPASQKVEE